MHLALVRRGMTMSNKFVNMKYITVCDDDVMCREIFIKQEFLFTQAPTTIVSVEVNMSIYS